MPARYSTRVSYLSYLIRVHCPKVGNCGPRGGASAGRGGVVQIAYPRSKD
jgi:hypothetical protein